MRRFYIFLVSVLTVLNANAIDLTECSINYDTRDDRLVAKMAGIMQSDIYLVSRKNVAVYKDKNKGSKQIVLGTVGGSPTIEKLAKEGVINADFIRGRWEQFIIKTTKDKLIIAGSDARGLAYGVMHVSKEIGINPWYWWADVPVTRRDYIEYEENYVSKSPSVKYRGIFINDEDWGLQPWAAKNYEKELGDIGPKTYAKVCELILRLGGNMLAPAMHDCTSAFYTYPESQKVAADYGIMITTSHCEPLLVNNACKKEWDSAVDGAWDYGTNRERILSKMDKRISDTRDYLNIYTTGLRGLHDEGMRGNYPMEKRVKLLEQVIGDEREILGKYILNNDATLSHKALKDVADIPQIFVPYKEALDIYDNGLRVPEDITLVWPDDNYGYLKRISNTQEQQRKGGSGIYYHLSYLGAPHDYLWVNTTPPALMYEELYKAYRTGADRYWLLNVGDIKPMELGMQTFFDMAWDIDAFSYNNINRHQSQFLASVFGKEHRRTFQRLLDAYYCLAWDRKPEYMGYEREWDNAYYEQLHDTDFSFETGTAQNRLESYREISRMCNDIESSLPEQLRPSFYEMIGFSVKASEQMNRKFLMAQLNHETGNADAAREAIRANDSIFALMDRFNNQLGGKWKHMMSIPPGYRAQYQNMPLLGKGADKTKIKPENTPIIYNVLMESRNREKFRIIEGMGTDWAVLQLGDALDAMEDPSSLSSSHTDLEFGKIDTDSVKVRISVLPLWPMFAGKSNRFGVSVDNATPQVCENKFKEYSLEWKDQVLVNSKSFTLSFPIDKTLKSHTLSLIVGDPGQMVQKVEILK